ncbi:MAG: hypothetical protein ACRDHZ_09795 [Ktedonobacteraceae bacterium]
MAQLSTQGACMYYQQPSIPPQPGMTTQFPQQYVPVSIMQQRLVRERVIFSVIALILLIIAYVIGYMMANNVWHQWFQINCGAYPFLLLNSNTHVACTLPTP